MSKELEAKIDEILTRGVENVYPSKEGLKALLLSGKRIRLYLGFDPTGPNLHMGHAVALRKGRKFQELGHEVIFLVGDFTAMIGDPTDKQATRKQLTREEVLDNCKGYKEQAKNLVAFEGVENPVQLRFNSEWLGKMSFHEVVELAAHFTVQQMLERDMFEKRIADGKPVGLHEFLYPLMQGYDSVAMDVDLEVGGNDQTFNMLAGRTLMKELKGKEKMVLAVKLLTDPTGKKMGKTEGNMITLADAPEDMYGKVMSWSDAMIPNGFEICTEVPMIEIEEIAEQLQDPAVNPRDLKMRLAREIVSVFYDKDAAEKAESHFVNTFSKKEIPADIRDVKVEQPEIKLTEFLVLSGTAESLGDARRKIEQGGVEFNGDKISDWKAVLSQKDSGAVLKVGKKDFIRVQF